MLLGTLLERIRLLWESVVLANDSYIPHGHCYLWQTPLVGLHVVSDALIAIAYFSIPILLLYFSQRLRNFLPIEIVVMFGSFIVLCGVGHLLEIWTLWHPAYWLSGVEQALTALVSCYTAASMLTLLPQFLSLKSPEELERINQQLEKEVASRRAAERELHTLNKNLEHLVSERTQELERKNSTLQKTQAQLVQSEKLASLGKLVGGIAHEINNPLSFIYGNIEHLREYEGAMESAIAIYGQTCPTVDSPAQNALDELELDFIQDDFPKLLDSMRHGADRIRNIVLSLRNFVRLDESDLKTVRLRDGLESSLVILSERLSQSGSEGNPAIEVRPSYADIPDIECYPSQLNQAVFNLLINAIEAIEARMKSDRDFSPSIEVATAPVAIDREGKEEGISTDLVEIRIADNGVPFPEALKNRIFEPFATSKPIGQGVGLGLAQSYSIITERHGGTLDLECGEDDCKVFVIRIPIVQSPAPSLQRS